MPYKLGEAYKAKNGTLDEATKLQDIIKKLEDIDLQLLKVSGLFDRDLYDVVAMHQDFKPANALIKKIIKNLEAGKYNK